MTYKKKLIEVALPLEAINRESAREKEPFTRKHPRALHIWWARRPLAACRAVLFASLVDDPSAHLDRFPTDDAQERERKRLFTIIEDLVRWENTSNEKVLQAARAEILASCNGNPPPILDPFCGGGSIPLEAQRLGLEAHASDLNPVAVLITKALIEIPPRFAGRPPVHPREGTVKSVESWIGAQGLAADVRYYGQWMREQAEDRIGNLYPKVRLPKEAGGGEATVIAWLWARTVICPNPACGTNMPLVRSFTLSTKKGKEAWVEPIIDRQAKVVSFEVRTGKGKVPDSPKVGRGAKFKCLVCGQVAPERHIKDEGAAGRMDAMPMAIVAQGHRERIYLAPLEEHAAVASQAQPAWSPEQSMPTNPRWFSPPEFGLRTYGDLYTVRQLVALNTFSDLVGEARTRVLADAIAAGRADDAVRLADGGSGATAYGDAVATYLGLLVSRWSDLSNSIASWNSTNQNVRALFARQAIPMAWDFTEVNPFGRLAPVDSLAESIGDALESSPANRMPGSALQLDASASLGGASQLVVCTDPPYYDNIGYADLSDFFYVWLRRTLHGVWPDLFATLLTPKAEELVATPYRFGGNRDRAEAHFEEGLGAAFARLRDAQRADYPATLFYAFKQAEEDEESGGVASTGWDTMLTALLEAGFAVVGTWPMRTERGARSVSIGTNALASSIVLVCRPREVDAPLATRVEFLGALRAELPEALVRLRHGSIAPVDLAQASIGPGMAVFSRYARVVEADGKAMPVRSALALINQVLDEILEEQEGDFDAESRWAVAWFAQYGMNSGPYGEADILARAKNSAVNALVESGILESKAGKVRLLDRGEMPPGWDPTTDRRLTVWEVAQHLLRVFQEGEQAAADLLRRVGGLGELAKELAYRMYAICERKGWSKEGSAYNELIAAWPEIARLAAGETVARQPRLGE